MKVFAETERLFLREIVPADEEGMYELDSDPEVHRYLGGRPVTDRQQIREVIAFIRQQYLDNGIGRWAVVEKASGNFIGWSGLKLMRETVNNHINYYDLGYRFIRKYWGQGFATEAALAALDYGFYEKNQENIYGIAHVQNKDSRKVLEKCGLKLEGETLFDGTPHHWLRISKTSWFDRYLSSPKVLTEKHKQAIYRLWNGEYPSQLKFNSLADLDSYLHQLQDPTHCFVADSRGKMLGWAFAFTREEARWFAIIIDSHVQGKALGKYLLEQLKAQEKVLFGWVIDRDDYVRADGTKYPSPMKFYLKNGFASQPETRLETEKISAVRIAWKK